MKVHNCNFENCTKSFKKPVYLLEHMNTHLNIKPFACSFCNLSYYKKRHLDRHMLLHKQKEHICTKCNIPFTENYKLQNHMKICNITYVCKCGKVYVRKKLYDRHCVKCKGVGKAEKQYLKNQITEKQIKEQQSEENQITENQIIEKQIKKPNNIILVQQQKAVSVVEDEYDTKYQCKHCGKEYVNKGNLYAHFRSFHMNLRCYECECGKGYLHNKNLKEHNKKCKYIANV